MDLQDSQFLQALYEGAEELLPEFHFINKGHYLNSRTAPAHITEDREKAQKFYITAGSPKRIRNWSTKFDTIDLFSYIAEREGLKNFYESLKFICNSIGFPLPEDSPEKKKQYEEERRKEKLLEDLKEHFSENLLSTAGRSSDTWKYLTEKRGFTEEQIETIGFGLFEGEKLLQFAQKHNYSIEEVKKHFSKKTLTEQQHTVVIPYYSGGKLHGFQLRIDGDYDTEKYQVTTGLKRGELLFNSPAFFTQKQNIILTEGEIDCLSLQHKLFGGEGAIHCLSLGGNSLKAGQLRLLKKAGADKTLLYVSLDYDYGKEEQTVEKTYSIIESLISEGFKKIRIIDLAPSDTEEQTQKRDPDSILKEENGKEKFLELMGREELYYEFFLSAVKKKYRYKIAPETYTTSVLHSIEEDLFPLYNSITEPTHKAKYREQCFSFLRTLPNNENYSESAFTEALKREEERHIEARKKSELTRATGKANSAVKAGNNTEAVQTLKDAIASIEKTEQVKYAELLSSWKEEDFLQAKLNTGEGIDIGLRIGAGQERQEILIPKEALTVIAGQTGNRKTAFMLNMLLASLTTSQSRRAVLFTYEEPSHRMLSYLFNAFLQKPISVNNRRSIESYFTAKAEGKELFQQYEMIRSEEREYVEESYKTFKRKYLETQRIRVIEESYTVESLIKAIKALKEHDSKIEVIFIDYFQLLYIENKKHFNSRQEELKAICSMLKDCAIETGLPIVLASQYNRTVQSIEHMKEQALSEAGDIERIASLIIGLWSLDKKQHFEKWNVKNSKETKWDTVYYKTSLYEKFTKGDKRQHLFCTIHKSRQTASGDCFLLPYEPNSNYMFFNETEGIILP